MTGHKKERSYKYTKIRSSNLYINHNKYKSMKTFARKIYDDAIPTRNLDRFKITNEKKNSNADYDDDDVVVKAVEV